MSRSNGSTLLGNKTARYAPQVDLSPAAVGQAVAEVFDGVDARSRVERLSRGFSWVTLGVDDVIVRVAPLGGSLDPYDPEAEAANLRRVEGIVPAPRVLAVQPEADNPIGRPFGVHTRVPGKVLRLDDVTEHRSDYIAAAALALGQLHSLSAPLTVAEAYDAESGPHRGRLPAGRSQPAPRVRGCAGVAAGPPTRLR